MNFPETSNGNRLSPTGGDSEVAAPVFIQLPGSQTGARAGDPLHASPCNPSLTRRMLNAMRFIQGYQEEHGVGPTYEEIAERFAMSSKGNAHWLVRRLIERGYMEFGPFKTKKRREVIILRPVPIPRLGGIPLQVIQIVHSP